MLLYEILEPVRAVTATARFRETYKAFRRQYSSLDSTLAAFVGFRCRHRPDEPYAIKDAPFTVQSELRGYRHYHMVHGRVILIYKVTPTELQLACLTDHSYSTAAGSNRLINFLHSPGTSYERLGRLHTLTAVQRQSISELLFQMAAEDRATLEQSVSGDLTDLLDYARLVIDVAWNDQAKDAAIFAAFDGKDGLIKAVRRVLQQTASRAYA